MGAQIRIIPESIVAGTAAALGLAKDGWPDSVYVHGGLGRFFVLMLVSKGVASATPTLDPLLKGQAHSDRDVRSGAQDGTGLSFHTWFWDEDKLAAAPIPNTGGSARITAGTPLWTTDPPTADPEYIWFAFTIEGGDKDTALFLTGRDIIGATTTFDIPTSDLLYGTEAELNVHTVDIFNGDDLSVIDSDATQLAKVTHTNHRCYLFQQRSSSKTVYTHTMDASTEDAGGSIFQITEDPALVSAVGSASLASRRPTTRSIDAKTLADAYNRGQPKKPDYTWPGGRKFYQDPPDPP